jgi:hypothetical protein
VPQVLTAGLEKKLEKFSCLGSLRKTMESNVPAVETAMHAYAGKN